MKGSIVKKNMLLRNLLFLAIVLTLGVKSTALLGMESNSAIPSMSNEEKSELLKQGEELLKRDGFKVKKLVLSPLSFSNKISFANQMPISDRAAAIRAQNAFLEAFLKECFSAGIPVITR